MNDWFMPALALLFIGLKLGGVIAWSWWWVLIPIWLPVIVLAALVLSLGAHARTTYLK